MKSKRHAKILELVEKYEIETQNSLTVILSQEGFDVTQATVSRDIHEMKLTKIPAIGGGYKYARPAKYNKIGMERLKQTFLNGFVSMDYTQNMLVIRTFNGMAMAVGVALDGMHLPEIIGCLAGDDVVMCAVKSEKDILNLIEKLKRVIQ